MIDRSASTPVEGISVRYRPAFMVSSAIRNCEGGGRGGDVALVLPLEGGRTAIVVIDVAGHGASRAPIASAITDEVIASLRRDASPAAALGRADERLRTFDDECPYAVAFVALVHPALRTVIYASAGHDVAFKLADDGQIRHLPPTSPMLGIPLVNYACDALCLLAPAETLVIATDGISDSRPAGTDHFFGAAGIARAVARSLRDGSDPAQAVLEDAYTHRGSPLDDDAAVVVVGLQPGGVSRRRVPRSTQARTRFRFIQHHLQRRR